MKALYQSLTSPLHSERSPSYAPATRAYHFSYQR